MRGDAEALHLAKEQQIGFTACCIERELDAGGTGVDDRDTIRR
jgi:hypothetical protein